jgi:hypothetical protein
MLRPLPTPEPVVSDTPEVGASASGPEHGSANEPVSQTKDTFSRAADWLRRLGKIPDEPEPERESATIGETVQAARAQADSQPQIGDETIALPIFDADFMPEGEAPTRPSSRNQRRFVLKVEDGRQFTIGDTPGGIGADSDHPAPDDGPWQWVHMPGEESVDPVHLFFGSENGVLWVADKGSAFGTIVIEPGQDPIQCEPEKRYFVIRGSELRLGGMVVTIH